MTLSIVDTNVAVVANGDHPDAGDDCQLACVEKLEEIVSGERFGLDEGGLILQEYRGYLQFAGEPGVGDMFYRYVFNHQYMPTRCLRVTIDSVSDADGTFAQCPKSLADDGFDRSDRKFVAVALASGEEATIYNAVDTDWHEHSKVLDAEGVVVTELCPLYIKAHAAR